MNCKPGDLAVIVADHFVENIGRLVEVVEGYESWFEPGVPTWIVAAVGDRPCRALAMSGGQVMLTRFLQADRDMRPIRDQPGEDETLTWAPVPGERTEVPV